MNTITTLRNSLVLAMAAMMITLNSCKKDEDTIQAETVSEEEIAELTASAISTEEGGYVSQINSVMDVYTTQLLSCGVQKDSTIANSVTRGNVSFQYAIHWLFNLICSGTNPSQLSATLNGGHSYNTLRMASVDSSTGQVTVSGLENNSSYYILNSNYTRNGSQTSKIGRQYTFTGTLSFTSSNITVDKTTLRITSGTAIVTITGASTSGNSFSYTGTITFLGNNTASLQISGGGTHSIQWLSK